MNDLRERLKKLISRIKYETPAEFIELALDLRPAIYMSSNDMTDERVSIITEIFPEFYIKSQTFALTDISYKVWFVFKDPSIAERIPGGTVHALDCEALGNLLGYPKCCVRYHQINNIPYSKTEKPNDPISTTKGYCGDISFTMNRLLNFTSRARTEEDVKMFDTYNSDGDLNINVNGTELKSLDIGFLSHIPCSVNCEESQRRASIIASWMKDNMFDTYYFYEKALKRPFLYFGEVFNWIAFEGVVKNNEIHFSAIAKPTSPIDNETMLAAKNSNIIRVEEERILFLKDEKIVLDYKKKNKRDGVLMNFI